MRETVCEAKHENWIVWMGTPSKQCRECYKGPSRPDYHQHECYRNRCIDLGVCTVMANSDVTIQTCCCNAPNRNDANCVTDEWRYNTRETIVDQIFSFSSNTDDDEKISRHSDANVGNSRIDNEDATKRAKFFEYNKSNDDEGVSTKSSSKEDHGEPQINWLIDGWHENIWCWSRYGGCQFKCMVCWHGRWCFSHVAD